MNEFPLIVITRPECFAGEMEILEALLNEGAYRLHVRKPAGAGVETEKLIAALAPRYRDRLVLHGEQVASLATRYRISQIHVPARLFQEINVANLTVSTSVHSWNEMWSLPAEITYALISPLFDSISKPGYLGKSELSKGLSEARPCKAIGLGGIRESNIEKVKEEGWDGAALLGYLWEQPEKAVQRFRQLQKLTITWKAAK